MDKKIKLNIPCWICDKDLILGEAIVTFGDDSHKSPAHLKCLCEECSFDESRVRGKNG